MRSRQVSLDKKLIRWIFFFLFAVILILTALTPMQADDYSYSFSYADRSRIQSLSDIIQSLQVHRDTMNGRMTAHFFAHLFLLLPKPVFSFLNAFVFCLIVFFLYRLVRGENERRNVFLLLLILFLTWLYTPVFGQVFLWLDGACNYAWGLCFILAYLSPYIAAYLHDSPLAPKVFWKKFLFLLLAFLAGSYSEGASFAALFIAFTFLLCLWHRDGKLPRFLLLGLVVACLGYLFLMTAPSEWSGRTGSFSPLLIAKNIKRIFSAPQETMLPLFVLYAALLAACFGCKARCEVIVTSVILFLGAWVSLVLFAVAIYFPWRSLLMMALLLIASCVLMLSTLCEKGFERSLPVFVSAVGALFLFQFVLGCGDVAFVYSQSRQREAAIEAALDAGSSQVWLDVYQADTKYSGVYLLADIYEDCWLWPNYDLAAYYGIDQVYGLPALQADAG